MPNILKLPAVKSKTGLSKSQVYVEVNKGRLKPPVRLGLNSVGWVESEVEEYILARIAERPALNAANPQPKLPRRPGRPQSP